MFIGVLWYVRSDLHFGLVPYMWLGIWYFFCIFEMILVKFVCDTVPMSSWTRTYYQVNVVFISY